MDAHDLDNRQFTRGGFNDPRTAIGYRRCKHAPIYACASRSLNFQSALASAKESCRPVPVPRPPTCCCSSAEAYLHGLPAVAASITTDQAKGGGSRDTAEPVGEWGPCAGSRPPTGAQGRPPAGRLGGARRKAKVGGGGCQAGRARSRRGDSQGEKGSRGNSPGPVPDMIFDGPARARPIFCCSRDSCPEIAARRKLQGTRPGPSRPDCLKGHIWSPP